MTTAQKLTLCGFVLMLATLTVTTILCITDDINYYAFLPICMCVVFLLLVWQFRKHFDNPADKLKESYKWWAAQGDDAWVIQNVHAMKPRKRGRKCNICLQLNVTPPNQTICDQCLWNLSHK